MKSPQLLCSGGRARPAAEIIREKRHVDIGKEPVDLYLTTPTSWAGLRWGSHHLPVGGGEKWRKKKSLVHNGCFFLVGAESPLAAWKGGVMFPRRRDRKTDEKNQTRVTLTERQDAEETGSNRIGRPRNTLVALPWFLHGSAHNSSLGEKESWVPTLSPTPPPPPSVYCKYNKEPIAGFLI